MYIDSKILFIIIQLILLLIHIIFTVIILIKLKKSGNEDVLKAAATVGKSLLSALGITNLDDALNSIKEIKDIVKKE